MDRDLALEALGALCNASVTSVQKQGSSDVSFGGVFRRGAGQQQQLLDIQHFIPTILEGEETCSVSNTSFRSLRSVLQSGEPPADSSQLHYSRVPTGRDLVIDENEFFDPPFDYDFSGLSDTETYYRGGEVYERPSGWYRFGLKVLNKYDDNRWLGSQYRTTQSTPGEWPVSYHGTSKQGAEGIIAGYYQPGPGQAYGRGIYSTPYISEAIYYAKIFTSQKTGKSYHVILQNRINAEYRQKHNNDKYWLIPIQAHISGEEEREEVQQAIRPYGLLLKEV
ncbi:uncharacterized protein LOC125015381 [Mugil cephalus]|uniref:uncharacterized protein LOC125015381 n=1 Tax=Mugil cephalus TaxID=48193 RepID=UPI001FB575DA|nr:uncharacterized protein LOC125015381 [Mugil cephalus]